MEPFNVVGQLQRSQCCVSVKYGNGREGEGEGEGGGGVGQALRIVRKNCIPFLGMWKFTESLRS